MTLKDYYSFQFHFGTIDSCKSFIIDYWLHNSFQFHFGTIDRIRGIRKNPTVNDFNSTLVRLIGDFDFTASYLVDYFNSTLVRLIVERLQTEIGLYLFISIPLWYD